MKVINTNELKPVQFTGGQSIRPILYADNMGFSFHITHVEKGGPYHWHYKHHKEACYCISGKAELINLNTKEKFNIEPGIIYLLDKNDNHTFEAIEKTILISIFNPPCVGDEHHDENGIYKKNDYIDIKAKNIIKTLSQIKNDYDAIEYITNQLTNKN